MPDRLNMDVGLPFIFVLLIFGSMPANAKRKNVKHRLLDLENELMIIKGRLGLCESRNDMISENSERLFVIELHLNDTKTAMDVNVDDKGSKAEFGGESQSQKSHMYDEDDIRMILEEFQQKKVLNARFREELSDLKASVRDVNEDVTQVVGDISDLKASVRDVNEDVTQVVGDISDLKAIRNATEIVESRCKQSNKENMAEVRTGMGSLNSSIVYLTQKLSEIDQSAEMALNMCKKADSEKQNIEANKGKQITTTRPSSCKEIFEGISRMNGVYTVYPEEQGAPVIVFCDMERDGGGWTVFQRRQDGSEDFYRDWRSYELGFGKLEGEFWLGNQHISEMTKDCCYELRIDLEDFEGNKAYAKYGTFQVLSKFQEYRLVVGNYSGNAGDSLSYYWKMGFTTKDKDNDFVANVNCAELCKGAWWYNGCGPSNLNGLYFHGGNVSSEDGIYWYHWKNTGYYSFKMTEMKYRKI